MYSQQKAVIWELLCDDWTKTNNSSSFWELTIGTPFTKEIAQLQNKNGDGSLPSLFRFSPSCAGVVRVHAATARHVGERAAANECLGRPRKELRAQNHILYS